LMLIFLHTAPIAEISGEKVVPGAITTSVAAVGTPPHQLLESNQSVLADPNQLVKPADVTTTLNVHVLTHPTADVAVAVTAVVPTLNVEPDAME